MRQIASLLNTATSNVHYILHRNMGNVSLQRKGYVHARRARVLSPEEIEARKEHKREYARRKRADIRMSVLQRYGAKCECCGESNPNFLAIDHPNNDGAAHRRRYRSKYHSIYEFLYKNNCPPNFRILCHNCNSARQYYGNCSH